MSNHSENVVEYQFNNDDLILQALTHSSYSHERKTSENNERLEFLGDAIIELVVSNYLFHCFPAMPEGGLTKIRANVVCELNLAKVSREIGLPRHVKLGRGEEMNGGRDRDSILSDVFEAVVGAIYLDGGMDCAKGFVEKFLCHNIERLEDDLLLRDYKTYLQETIQKNSKEPIVYNIVNERGPDHNKLFTAQVVHSNIILGTGQGKNKKEAEQDAAYNAVKQLGNS